MIEVIMAIAALCQLHAEGSHVYINSYQQDCQQYYAKCMIGTMYGAETLLACMAKRPGT